MVVFIVVLQRDHGIVAGVFSTQKKAAEYMVSNPYSSFVIFETTVDEPEYAQT